MLPRPLTLTLSHPFGDASSAEETAVNGRGDGTERKSGERSLSNLSVQPGRGHSDETANNTPGVAGIRGDRNDGQAHR